jgi:hypothetical protein
MKTNTDQPIVALPAVDSNSRAGELQTLPAAKPIRTRRAVPVARWTEVEGFAVTIARRFALDEAAVAAFFLRPAPICILGRFVS